MASLEPVSPPRSLEGDPEKGRLLYTICATCHGANGEGNQQLFGPAVNRTSDWYLLDQLKKYKSGVRGGNPKDTTGIMMRPMALALPDEQAMQDVVAYMMTPLRLGFELRNGKGLLGGSDGYGLVRHHDRRSRPVHRDRVPLRALR